MRPEVTAVRWAHPPVSAAPADCGEECAEEILIVRAHDPDSSITEIQVRFGDGAPFVFAHTHCVQGPEAGIPARLEIGVAYPAAGTSTVEVVAYSHRRCLGHESRDGHPQRHSEIASLVTEVLPAEPTTSPTRSVQGRARPITSSSWTNRLRTSDPGIRPASW